MQVAVAVVEVDLAVANAPTAEILSLVSHSHLVVETEMIIDSFSQGRGQDFRAPILAPLAGPPPGFNAM